MGKDCDSLMAATVAGTQIWPCTHGDENRSGPGSASQVEMATGVDQGNKMGKVLSVRCAETMAAEVLRWPLLTGRSLTVDSRAKLELLRLHRFQKATWAVQESRAMSPSPSQWRAAHHGVGSCLGTLRVKRGQRIGRCGRNGVAARSAKGGSGWSCLGSSIGCGCLRLTVEPGCGVANGGTEVVFGQGSARRRGGPSHFSPHMT